MINPYVTDRGMIRRIEKAALRGARVRMFVPASPNNWACGAAEQFHHQRLLDAGVRILGYPKMLHAKAFVADGEQVLVGTCNLEAWSLKRFFEIDLGFVSADLAGAVRGALLRPGRGGQRRAGAAVDAQGARPRDGDGGDLTSALAGRIAPARPWPLRGS